MDWRSKPRKKKSKIWTIEKCELEQFVKTSTALSQILEYMSLATSSSNYRALKNRLNEDCIDYSHISLGLASNKNRKDFWLTRIPIPLKDVLIQDSSYDRGQLKIRLLKNGMLKNQCYECGLGPEWNGKPLSLQIDHINGKGNDHRLLNLRILCPNCHCQTDTYAGKGCIKK